MKKQPSFPNLRRSWKKTNPKILKSKQNSDVDFSDLFEQGAASIGSMKKKRTKECLELDQMKARQFQLKCLTCPTVPKYPNLNYAKLSEQNISSGSEKENGPQRVVHYHCASLEEP